MDPALHKDRSSLPHNLARMRDVLVRLTSGAVVLLATAFFALMSATVLMRCVFRYGVSWSEEISRYLLIWISLLGSAVAVTTGDHLSFDFLLNRLPPRIRSKALQSFRIIILAFSVTICLHGIRLFQLFGSDAMENSLLTLRWVYASIPLAGALMAVLTTLTIVLAFSDESSAGDKQSE